MKKIFNLSVITLLAGFFAVSCDRNDEDEIQNVEAIKIDSVKIAQDTMDVFTIQTIKTYSTYPSACDDFFGYDYIRIGLERNVVAYSYKINGTCTQATRVGVNGFNFRPEEKGIYSFKFWNGKDSSNQNIWIEKTIVVE